MLNNTTSLYKALHRSNFIPHTKEDKEEMLDHIWFNQHDKKVEKITIKSILEKAGVVNCYWMH